MIFFDDINVSYEYIVIRPSEIIGVGNNEIINGTDKKDDASARKHNKRDREPEVHAIFKISQKIHHL